MGEDAAAKALEEKVSNGGTLFSFLVLKKQTNTLLDTKNTFSHFCAQRQQGEKVEEDVISLPPEQFGRPKAPAGTWASCIRIIDPVEVRFSHYFHA